MSKTTHDTSVAVWVPSATLAVMVLALTRGCGPGAPDASLETAREFFPGATRAETATVPRSFGPRGRLHVVEGRDGALGYIVDRQVVSRSGPFQIRIVVDREFRVVNARVLEYPGRRGGQVRQPSFTRQFQGKGLGDPIRLGEDIDAVTGATISSRVMTNGVRRTLRRLRRLFRDASSN